MDRNKKGKRERLKIAKGTDAAEVEVEQRRNEMNNYLENTG